MWAGLRAISAAPTVAGQGASGRSDARLGADVSWRSVIDALPDAVIVLSGAGRVLRSSRAARELFTALRDGQTLDLATRNPDLLGAVEQALATRAPATVQTVERVPVERRLSATLSPLQAGNADTDGPALLLVFRDISQEERLAQMRADFVANASHELRTPLTSLRGFIETLQGQASNDAEARDKFLDIMCTQAGRMTRLIDDLLSLSRLEMRAHVVPRGEVEINALVHEVVDLLQPLAREAGMAMTFAGEPAECVVRGDRDELAQVSQNLVQNAIKYGGRDGHVDVVVTRTPAGATRAIAFRRDTRRWARHRRGPSAAADRAFLSRRHGCQPRQGRHRPRPRHRQARSEPPRRSTPISSSSGRARPSRRCWIAGEKPGIARWSRRGDQSGLSAVILM